MAESNGSEVLTPQTQAKVETVAREENRPPSEVLDDMVDAYIKRKALSAELHELAAEGRSHVTKLGLKPKNQAEADRIVNTAIQELRAEDKVRGK